MELLTLKFCTMKTEIKNCEDYRRLLCRVYDGLRNKELTEKEAKEMTKEADKTARQAKKELMQMKKTGSKERHPFWDVDYNQFKD